MKDFLYFLSGEVPGGILLLIFLLIVMNLALYFIFKSSKLFSGDIYKRKAIRANIYLLGVYIILWVVLKPPGLPDRVMLIPFQNNAKEDYVLTEALQRQLNGQLINDYTYHRWEWFYQTANKDSIKFSDYRINLARKIGAAVILTGELEQRDNIIKIEWWIIQPGETKKLHLEVKSYQEAADKIIAWIQKNMSVYNEKLKRPESLDDESLKNICQAKLLILNDQYDQVLSLFQNPDSNMAVFITHAYLDKGILEINKKEASNLHNDQLNRNFQRLLNLLIPYSKEGKDTADMNIILARMYLHAKNYRMAEICLEKALTQEKYNPRIYYHISYLHESRYRERGFKTRASVLDYSVRLDPGYVDAVYELAENLYETGTAAPTNLNTIQSMEVLRHFVRLNPNNEKILALLGKILLQSKYTPEAIEIYTKLINLDPNAATYHYNLGICHYHMKDFERAREQFKQAIEMDDYADAYLYLGAMHRLDGDRDKALYYYRERVKRKKGEDDTYAVQAMRGIRLILNEIAEEEEQAATDEDPYSDHQ